MFGAYCDIDFRWLREDTKENGSNILKYNDISCFSGRNGLQLIKAYAHGQSRIGETECIRSISTQCLDESYFRLMSGTKLEGLQEEFYYTYDRPLLLVSLGSTIPAADKAETPQDIYVASVVLIFNLALAYHNYAKKSGLSSSLQHA